MYALTGAVFSPTSNASIDYGEQTTQPIVESFANLLVLGRYSQMAVRRFM